MTFIAAAVAGAVGIGTAVIGARASGKATDAQKDAADDQVALSREQFNRQDRLSGRALKRQGKTNSATFKRTQNLANTERGDLDRLAERNKIRGTALATQAYGRNMDVLTDARDDVIGGFRPAQRVGNNALLAYAAELGIGSGPKGYEGLSLSPATRFLMEQGRTTVEGGAAGAGGLYSGATAEALERMRIGLANQDHDDQMAQLFGLGGVGIDATNKIADATGRYSGAIAGLNDQNYARHFGVTDDYLGSLGQAARGFTDRSTNNANAFADRQGAARGARVSFGQNAGQNYVSNASNAFAAYGQAGANGAYNTANAITGGIQNGLGVYGMLGGTFGGGGPEVMGSTQWPLNKPPMARPF